MICCTAWMNVAHCVTKLSPLPSESPRYTSADCVYQHDVKLQYTDSYCFIVKYGQIVVCWS